MWDILYDLLFEPHSAMGKIAIQRNAGQALIVALFSILLPIVAVGFGMKHTGMWTMIYVMIGIKIVASILVWIIGAAIWHLIAEFFGGRGTAVGLFSALGFAHLPRVFIVPLWAFISVMPENSKNILMVIAVLMILFWSVMLDVVAIKEVHQLTTAKAVLVMIVPLLMVGLLCLVSFIFISSSLIHIPMWI